jgi:adenosylmethionine-8-amino-7-oxononanoate aminotransferase
VSSPAAARRPDGTTAGGTPAHWRRLLALDRAHVWHPYSPLPASPRPLAVTGAEGVRLRLADGRELVDGMSSWWCAVHGYRHPAIDAALGEQLQRMAHVMFGGLTHEGALRLAARLVELTPAGLEHVFFADSGSVAVEVAIKMALQYWRARGRPERRRLLTVRGGYHGDTFGAMALCDPVGGMHHLFAGTLAEHVFVARPPDGFAAPLDEHWGAHVRAAFARHAHELAGAIIEPVVQGAGGMRFHSPAVVALLRECCDEHGLLLIADEIATGFGRSGALFACQHADVAPDLMCVGKALTGGYLSLAATLCTPAVTQAICAGPGGALMHGPTFMANPLACAAALASLELLEPCADGAGAVGRSAGGAGANGGKDNATGGWRADVRRIERALARGLAPARGLSCVADVRVLGAIGVIELRSAVDVALAQDIAVRRGVWLRPFRELIYTMPPYVTGEDDLAAITDAMVAAAAAHDNDRKV